MASITGFGQTESDNTTQPQIAVFGTFHFAGSTDYASVEFDPLDSEKRQKEISDLIEKLKAFQPTKILLEYPSQKAQQLSKRYQSYLEGHYELTINEIDQLGLRMAKALGHEDIYAIDYRLDLPFQELFDFAQKNDKQRLDSFLGSIKTIEKEESEILSKTTLLDYLIAKNSPREDIRNKNLYLNETTKFVNDSSYVGAEFTSKWWERNFMMMANIDQVTQPNDRLLVIVGAAHRAILRDFLRRPK